MKMTIKESGPSGNQNASVREDIILIIPTEMISYKVLSFPFELKNAKQEYGLARTALEGLTPLDPDSLYIIANRISKNRLLVEYFKKEPSDKIFVLKGLPENIAGKAKIYAPFFLIHSYIKDKLFEKDKSLPGGEKAAGRVSVLWKPGRVKFTYSGGELEGVEELSQADADAGNFDYVIMERELETRILSKLAKGKKWWQRLAGGIIGNTVGGRPPAFLSYGALIRSRSGGFNGDGIILNYLKKVSLVSIAVFFVIILYFALNNYYNYQKIKTIQSKINKIMLKYYPGQKIFYEPGFDIKSYYDKLKSLKYSNEEGIAVLNFLKYVSGFKNYNAAGPGANAIKLTEINYSFGSIDFSGETAGGAARFNNLLSYLKSRYARVKVIKSHGKSFDVLITLSKK